MVEKSSVLVLEEEKGAGGCLVHLVGCGFFRREIWEAKK